MEHLREEEVHKLAGVVASYYSTTLKFSERFRPTNYFTNVWKNRLRG